MKSYPNYKSSGVEWIGDIPYDWQAIKIKFSDKLIMGQSPESKDVTDFEKGLPFLQGNAEFTDTHPIPKNWCEKPNKFAIEDDLLLSVRAPVGALNVSDQTYGIGRGLCAIRAKKNNHRFLYYIFSVLKEELNKLSTGTTFVAITIPNLSNIKIPRVNLSEQLQIVSFLDRQTAEIDRVIATRENQIELLNELRVSVISKAVTKGIDPNAKLKSSGVEWIGEIPEAWNLSKVKSLLRKCKYAIKTGPFGTQLKGDDLKEEGDVRVYNQRSVIDDDFTSTKYFVTNEKAQQLKPFFTQPEDILVTSRGTIGKTSILPSNVPSGILHPCLIALRLNNSLVLNEWIKIYFNETDCFKTNIFLNSNSTTIEVIYSDTLKNVFIPIPSIKEQKTILEHIKNETSEIDSVIQKYNLQIELLKSYKTSLISEVVTGKIDVREQANN